MGSTEEERRERVEPGHRVLTRTEAAKWLRFSVRTLDALVKQGAIRCKREGRRVLFLVEWLVDYMRRERGEVKGRECDGQSVS